ncbi:MAG: hypothetical protein MUC96_37820, partial [Myxococcaceae bacterium]|nr:hypothetical protein [Myxococcaceae bacterium]
MKSLERHGVGVVTEVRRQLLEGPRHGRRVDAVRAVTATRDRKRQVLRGPGRGARLHLTRTSTAHHRVHRPCRDGHGHDDALECSAPPHGGIALGRDRVAFLITETESLRL